jgi:hypothetical protein
MEPSDRVTKNGPEMEGRAGQETRLREILMDARALESVAFSTGLKTFPRHDKREEICLANIGIVPQFEPNVVAQIVQQASRGD